MKFLSYLLLAVSAPFPSPTLAKYATTGAMKKRSGDDQHLDTSTTSEIGASRLLKAQKSPKAPKTSKSPKTPKSPKVNTTAAPATAAPTSPAVTNPQIFYSETATQLEQTSTHTEGGKSRTYFIDLGVVKGNLSEETMGLVQTSFTTSIDFDTDSDDGDSINFELNANVYLEILAYSGCNSAATCASSGITPTKLIPNAVEMAGWHRDYEFKEINYDDFQWQDAFTSTNTANFVLVGKGSGDFFLQASITIESDSISESGAKPVIDILVHNWVVIIEALDGSSITSSDAYNLVPTASPII